MDITLETKRGNLQRIGANQTSATSSLALVTTVASIPKNYQPCRANNAMIYFFSDGGADNDAVPVRVVLWRWAAPIESQDGALTRQLIPDVVFAGTATMGTFTGAGTGTMVPSTARFADTLAATSAATVVTEASVFSPANNTIARLNIDCNGAAFLSVYFEPLSGSKTCNALYEFY